MGFASPNHSYIWAFLSALVDRGEKLVLLEPPMSFLQHAPQRQVHPLLQNGNPYFTKPI